MELSEIESFVTPVGDNNPEPDACPADVKVPLLTLGQLPIGGRLVLKCRKDWRDASVVAKFPEVIVLSVGSPSGHSYRVKRPAEALLFLEGSIPLLGKGLWRPAFVRYDLRW